jgi:PhnB protein
MKINTYLNFNGQCEEAFRFYAEVLGGQNLMMMKYAQSPAADQTTPAMADKVMHAQMTVGGQVLMGSDGPASSSRTAGFAINVGVTDPAEAERIFHALAEGGHPHMPLAETFWAVRFGMLVDRFGIPWMVNCEKPMP